MADFDDWTLDGGDPDQGGGAATPPPRIDGGLLDPSTFPTPWPPITDSPQLDRPAPEITGPLDTDVHAQVLQDILNAQAKLPPIQLQSSSDGGFRHIDPYPGMNRTPAGGNPPLTRHAATDFLNGIPLPEGAFGPHVTFINDEVGNPSPNQPVTNGTANMVEQAIMDSGVKSVNINSTTGGHHDPSSRHPLREAVDIDIVNGLPVSSANVGGRLLQDAAGRQPNIRENFGPSYQVKTYPGHRPLLWPQVKERHDNHDHFSGQK